MQEKGKRFAAFDLDGTLIRWQLYHAIADSLARRGHINPETYQKMRDARMDWKKRTGSTFGDYEKQVIQTYETVLKTLSFQQFDEAIQTVFDEYKDQVYTYTRNLIKDLKSQGYLLFAISGSQKEIVEKIANYYDFDDFVGTDYFREEDKFTGDKFVASHSKDSVLKELATKHSAEFDGSIAVGDSESDIPMLELVERPIAFNPEAELFKYAKDKGWGIVVERKNVIYRLDKNGEVYELA